MTSSNSIYSVMDEVYFLRTTAARTNLQVLSLKTTSNAWIVMQAPLILNTHAQHKHLYTHTANQTLTQSIQSSSAIQLCDLIKYLAGPCGWPFQACLTRLLYEKPTARNQATSPLMRSEVWTLSFSQAQMCLCVCVCVWMCVRSSLVCFCCVEGACWVVEVV